MKKVIASLLLVNALSFCNSKYIFAEPEAPDPSAAGMVVIEQLLERFYLRRIKMLNTLQHHQLSL